MGKRIVVAVKAAWLQSAFNAAYSEYLWACGGSYKRNYHAMRLRSFCNELGRRLKDQKYLDLVADGPIDQ